MVAVSSRRGKLELDETSVVAWFEGLLEGGRKVPGTEYLRRAAPAMAWLAEAETALASVFPPGHPIRTTWQGIVERAKKYTEAGFGGRSPRPEPYANVHFNQALGVMQAAVGLLKAGRLRGLVDGVRAETAVEVLDQAQVLLTGKHGIAATVLAGGALETHLLHLCVRHALTWPGKGSISKYDQAIAQARNAGTVEVYPSTDSQLITGWGGLRNKAAHHPTTFSHTEAEVRLMIEGIRQFLARVP